MNMAVKPRIVRGLAVLFLLFTLVDIASPPACCENAELLSPARGNSAQLIAGAPISSKSGSEQSPDKGCSDEDCCFFCAHMLPLKVLATEFVLDLNSPSLVLNQTLIPSSSLGATYHPPRFL
jgi:hypothetical protein